MIKANPVVRKTAVAAMFMTSVAGMGAAKAENRTPKSDYTTATNEILPAAYPLLQAQTTKPMVMVRNTALENKALSFAKTEAERAETKSNLEEMTNLYGTYVVAVAIQNFMDEEVIKDYVNNHYSKEFPSTSQNFLKWFDNEYNRDFSNLLASIAKESNPYSPEEVLEHIEKAYKDSGCMVKTNLYDVDKTLYKLNYGNPSTPIEWSNYIAFCFYCLECYTFNKVLGIPRSYIDSFKEAVEKAVVDPKD